MCNFMSFILTCEPFQLCRVVGNDSHADIATAFGFMEDDTNVWVRIEYHDGILKIDERETPAWVATRLGDVAQWCKDVYDICDAARAEYDKVRDAARAEYDNICDIARAEYKNKEVAALETNCIAWKQ